MRSLLDSEKAAGPHSVFWDGFDDEGVSVASGVYFCRMVADDLKAHTKLLLIN